MFKSIFFRTLVAVTIVLLIKIALNFSPEISVPGYEKKVHVSELIEVSDVTVLFTGAFFVIGIILAGTMADYKESEKLPGEAATILEMNQVMDEIEAMEMVLKSMKSTKNNSEFFDMMRRGG